MAVCGPIVEPNVEESLDGDEPERACPVGVDLDKCRCNQFDRFEVPKIHGIDVPAPDQLWSHSQKLARGNKLR